ncbi:predicted protein [Nematostella vectensis]|uniref:Uncharacterized protein n=1 Tax=Nematostella vectensis TaxID=45351 RepID=A7S608_NEMVE|nr:predicted protein [Nematostella vectensis]|eukprot:XP_001632916.1 predicted protein [Nematostella vectensis]
MAFKLIIAVMLVFVVSSQARRTEQRNRFNSVGVTPMYTWITYEGRRLYCPDYTEVDITQQEACNCPFLGCMRQRECLAGRAHCWLNNVNYDQNNMVDSDCDCKYL